VTVRTRAPGVIDAARVTTKIAATVYGKNLEFGVALQDAIEDQVVQSQRRLERIADNIVEIEPLKTFRVGEAIGMQHHQHAEFFRLFPEWRKGRIRQLLAGDIGDHLKAGKAQLPDAAFEFFGRFVAIRHRHGAKSLETVGLLRTERGDAVVDNLR